jgi:hypothetical protein
MARYAERNRAVVALYLSSRACVDCGEADPRVLEFDHVRGKKLGNVSSLRTGGYSLERLEAELAKCEVRCANCHRRKTVQQFGWRVLYGA